MKAIFALLILLGKLYLGFRILWWIVLKINHPELHNIFEIDVFLVLLVFDVWIGNQSIEIEKIEQKNKD